MRDETSALLSDHRHRQLCALYAREARDVFPGRSWPEIEPLVRRAWERTPRDLAWRDAAPVVKSFWLIS